MNSKIWIVIIKIDGMGINWHLYILHYSHHLGIHWSWQWDQGSNKKTETWPENCLKVIKISETNHWPEEILSIVSFSTRHLTAQYWVLPGYLGERPTDSLREGVMETQKRVYFAFCSQVVKSWGEDLWKLTLSGNGKILYQSWVEGEGPWR